MYGAMKNAIQTKTCAIYTRKSTDEGLDMEFNTLDAQRESCEAYIMSQKSEGWRASVEQYNDGGYSGGTMDRPALNRLVDDIKSGKVQIVVVYKIDRLTRSLMDFSKLVEVFDEHGVTFVSVTQSFNTTTSMGRLTLNVLLSFAQFEREVTGERIRDKIAASKKKGMWMGGAPPVGYRIENRQLYINPDEEQLVQSIFDRYLKLGSVRVLKQELDVKNIRSPKRISQKGKHYGDKHFSRGALYTILKNPTYIGRIKHKKKIYEGMHDGIIPIEKWQRVQSMLEGNAVERSEVTKQRHLLTGLIFDPDSVPYSPTFTKKRNKQYCYYISQNLLQYKDHPKGLIARLPAHEIEQVVEFNLRKNIARLLYNADDPRQAHLIKHLAEISGQALIKNLVTKITIDLDHLYIEINRDGLRVPAQESLQINLPENVILQDKITVPYSVRRGRNGTILINPEQNKTKDILDLPADELKRLIQGIDWRERHFSGEPMNKIAKDENYNESYIRHTIMKSFKSLMRGM